ncbi:MAG: hypothetical protein KGZ96_11315 [Clostridia bacterium]|nr:hypothetical protein [Clostridia bacterium]
MSIYGDTDKKSGQIQIEDAIKQIKGIISCNVVISSEGKIEEVHILAQDNRFPKQVVRDVESAVMAQLGIELDHKKISVAQAKGNSPEARSIRPTIERVEINGSKNWINSNVYLRVGENIFEGSAEGANTGLNRYKLLAAATAKALEEMVEHKIRLVVEDFCWQVMAENEVGTVVVSCVSDRKVELVVGSSIASNSKDEAPVKAMLDALNRRLDYF